MPTMAPGVKSELLKPIKTWASKEDYEATAKKFAYMFRGQLRQIRNACRRDR